MSVWPTIERFISDHGAAALVTLADARGSSPREVGARMVVRPDGAFTGTIGGGALEWIALAEAQALLAERKGAAFRRLDKALGPDLGQCCGGRVIVTLERFDAADGEAVATLADLERAGPLVTVAASRDGKLARRAVSPSDDVPPEGPRYARLPDGRIVERFGTDATPFYLFGAGHVGRASPWRSRRCRSPSPGSIRGRARFHPTFRPTSPASTSRICCACWLTRPTTPSSRS